MALLALFARLLMREGRRDAAREAEVLMLAKAALEDSLTGLSNRRKLAQDLDLGLARASASVPLALTVFDLDGFKDYNDTFGHPAGDVLLTRLGRRLHTVAGSAGEAYRLGGDEFCLLAAAHGEHPERLARLGAAALSETGKGFAVGCSYGIALLPHEAASSEEALRLADRRLYVSKQSGRTSARTQSCDVLLATMSERHEGLTEHNNSVAALAERLAERLGLASEQVETIRRAAELHDVGKVAIPDEILSKPGPLTEDEWVFMRQHSVIGERILSAAPALAQVAALVRAKPRVLRRLGLPRRACRRGDSHWRPHHHCVRQLCGDDHRSPVSQGAQPRRRDPRARALRRHAVRARRRRAAHRTALGTGSRGRVAALRRATVRSGRLTVACPTSRTSPPSTAGSSRFPAGSTS
jgi:diguanylate cyclase (GGDEF)-like protein/putative nucleotidyltransferase with HDIG domain